jgi:ubiquitin-protein ligase
MQRRLILKQFKISQEIPNIDVEMNTTNINKWKITLEYGVFNMEIPQNYPMSSPEFRAESTQNKKYANRELICLGEDANLCVGIPEYIALLIAIVSER